MAEDPAADLASTLARSGTLDSTLQLIERARAGDQEALDRLMARHMTPLRRWARGRLPHWARDIADTQDLVQDALLQTFRRIGALDVRGPGSLLAYLRQAVLNRVRDELRKKGRRPDSTDLDEGDPDPGRSPLEEAIGRESLERYELALAKLTPLEQEAIVGRVEMGYSYDELAEILGKPGADAARKATRRALIRLAEHLELPDA
jgi:RNA polymerase sigma-70 factor (ECF subfamily)